MPTVVNGRTLGVERNGIFTAANTDPIFEGRLWTDAAASWRDMRAAALADGIQPWEFAPAGPNSSARSLPAQEHFWFVYKRDGFPVAAVPGTSNHGWAIAVDVKTRRAAAWIIANGHRFGWSHDEGLRVGEWWHMRYLGGYKAKRHPAPLVGLKADERRWCRELDRLRRTKQDTRRQQVLVNVLTKRRKAIFHVAQETGWTKWHRRERYHALLARTHH